MNAAAVTATNLPLGKPMRGKVRDCYRFTSPAFGDALAMNEAAGSTRCC